MLWLWLCRGGALAAPVWLETLVEQTICRQGCLSCPLVLFIDYLEGRRQEAYKNSTAYFFFPLTLYTLAMQCFQAIPVQSVRFAKFVADAQRRLNVMLID